VIKAFNNYDEAKEYIDTIPMDTNDNILKEFKIKVTHGKFTVRSRYRSELAGSVEQIEASIKAMEGLIKSKSKKKNKKE
jgi:hypothetical protein